MTTTLNADIADGPADGQLVALGTMAREMFSEAKLDDTVDKVVALAAQTFPCDGVGLLLAPDGEAVTVAAFSQADAARADALQLETRQGPGLQAIDRHQPVIATELRFDSRWRFWAPLAADLGFRSVLSLSLADGDTTGALNLYSRHPSFFQTSDLPLAQVFAQHASIAVAVAAERQQLLHAIQSRGVVGQAQGILMHRYGISDEQAMTILRRYSTHLEQKLRVVAEGVIRDQRLPELDLVDEPPHAVS
ncbi:MAG TPA: GAF and ANTAR domain-containing protein [Propionibacteriaceae bacterium]|jgi:transcriptional regulator with GAF, ATPase, and Fis domain